MAAEIFVIFWGSSLKTDDRKIMQGHWYRGVQTLETRSPWRIIYARWRPIFLGPAYGTCWMSPSGAQNFEVTTLLLENYVHPCIGI